MCELNIHNPHKSLQNPPSKMSHERYLEMLIETKKTRVAGEPRHLADAYLDELERVGGVPKAVFGEASVLLLVIPCFSVYKEGEERLIPL